MPDFFGCKNFKARFFLDAKFFVRKFLGQKNCAAGKMVGLMDCAAPFSEEAVRAKYIMSIEIKMRLCLIIMSRHYRI